MFIAGAAVITVFCLIAGCVHCLGGGYHSFVALLLAVFIAGAAVITVLMLLLLAVFIAGAAVITVYCLFAGCVHCLGGGNHSFLLYCWLY